jgi:hypothetical protein
VGVPIKQLRDVVLNSQRARAGLFTMRATSVLAAEPLVGSKLQRSQPAGAVLCGARAARLVARAKSKGQYQPGHHRNTCPSSSAKVAELVPMLADCLQVSRMLMQPQVRVDTNWQSQSIVLRAAWRLRMRQTRCQLFQPSICISHANATLPSLLPFRSSTQETFSPQAAWAQAHHLGRLHAGLGHVSS